MTSNVDICPVCDMVGKFDTHTMEFNQRSMNFCSEQCKEMFAAHPSLYIGKSHRTKELKKRTVRLAEPLDAEPAQLIASHLRKMMGVSEVVVEGDKVSITYDLLQVTEEKIEQAITDADLPLSKGLLERLRRAWVHSGEETELDNLSAKPVQGCHGRPRGT